jgi:hypothetical protein
MTRIPPINGTADSLLRHYASRDEELQALTEQGTIQCERRGSKTVYRLRYRFEGRQRARYVRARDVAALEAELDSLQRRMRGRRQRAALVGMARRALRDRKLVLSSVVETRGYYFHGHQIRRRRNRQKQDS